MQLETPSRPAAGTNPARARGLKRATGTRAVCEPADWTPMPAAVPPVHVLGLLTRVRADQVAAAKISDRRLHDVRAYKCVAAELGYLQRLAHAGKTGGTIVTSMPQLVSGLARLHPAWRMDGDKFADRDRHHSAVRRRLHALQAMGLLRWRVGVDVDGEDARTELQLLDAPPIGDDERAAATAQLARWQARYGAALNTGSRTGIRNAAKHSRPLSAGERQRRGVARTRARTRSRRDASTTNSAPHFVAPPTSENNLQSVLAPANHPHNACELRTGVTRASAAITVDAGAAGKPLRTASLTPNRPSVEPGEPWYDKVALLERVKAREKAREPVLQLIAAQADARAQETRAWTMDRGWPRRRLCEAWVCVRHGSRFVAEYSASAAGWLRDEDYARLRRAVARYDRNATACPIGYPASGLAALFHIGELAAAGAGGPRLLGYAIGALDQLSRRMRAVRTDRDPARLQRASRLARDRRSPAAPVPGLATRITFRIPRPAWPPWVELGDQGEPLIVDGELVLREGAGPCAPPLVNSDEYRVVLRDAYLLNRGDFASHVDGRAQMSVNSDRLTGGHTGRAAAGPYPDDRQHRDRVDRDVLELARRTGMGVAEVHRVAPDVRACVLADVRRRDAVEIRRQAAELQRRLAAPRTPTTPSA